MSYHYSINVNGANIVHPILVGSDLIQDTINETYETDTPHFTIDWVTSADIELLERVLDNKAVPNHTTYKLMKFFMISDVYTQSGATISVL